MFGRSTLCLAIEQFLLLVCSHCLLRRKLIFYEEILLYCRDFGRRLRDSLILYFKGSNTVELVNFTNVLVIVFYFIFFQSHETHGDIKDYYITLHTVQYVNYI